MAVQKKRKLINWQLPMKRVLYALIPIVAFSVYLFGWRALAMLVLCNALAFACEYAFQKPYKEPVTAAVFVTGTLFALSLPPLLPFWMAAVFPYWWMDKPPAHSGRGPATAMRMKSPLESGQTGVLHKQEQWVLIQAECGFLKKLVPRQPGPVPIRLKS